MSEMYLCPEQFDSVAVSELKPGDKTRFSYGQPVTVRTVSRVEWRPGGILAVYYRETWEPYHDEFASSYKVLRLKPGAKPVKPKEATHA